MTIPERGVTRRDALKLMGLGAGGVLLVACTGTSGTSSTTLAGASSTTLAGSGSTTAAGASGSKVTLWTHVAQDEQNWFAAEWATQAAGSGLDLEIVPMAHGDLHTKVLANMSTGEELPDIMGLTHDFWGRYLGGTLIEDNLAAIDDVVADVMDDAIGLSAWTKNSVHYGMREDIATTAYWFREDLLAAAGITTPIATWDDFKAAASSLQAPTTYMMPVVIDQLFFNYPLISQLSGPYWTADGKWSLNTPEALEVITYLKQGLDDGIFYPIGQGDFWGSAFFTTDEVAGAVMPSWYGTFVLFPGLPDQSGAWRVQNLPTWGGRGHASSSVWGGTAWVFNKNGANVDAVLEIAKKMYFDTAARVRYAETAKNLPAFTPALADPTVSGIEEPFLDGQQQNQVFFDALADSVQAIQSANDAEIAPIVDTEWTTLMSGGSTPGEFLSNVDEQIQGLGIELA